MAFELERFELTGEDRLELSGRWFGVRGRRFIRPTLTLVADGEKYRGLADLAHKPWAAEDGEPWQAAFVCELAGAEVIDAELNVTPDITVSLPAPSGSGGGRARAQPASAPRPGRDRRASACPGTGVTAPRTAGPPRTTRCCGASSDRCATRSPANAARPPSCARSSNAHETGASEISARLEQLSADLEVARQERDRLIAERGGVIAERDEASPPPRRPSVSETRH